MKTYIQLAAIVMAMNGLLFSGACSAGEDGIPLLSPMAKMSLLTASPGPELYSVFGHSALWVYDPINGIDEVYNWGTFDFNTPNFYPLFIRGRLLYMLTVSPLNRFLYSYRLEGRSVDEQVLMLNADEQQRIYNYLQINRRPENIHYLYDFFYDNCATRVRDLVDRELDLDWGPDPFPSGRRSFRSMLHPYVEHIPWAAFGIDILLGLPADGAITPWHYMYLPDEMALAFSQARHADGRPLVMETRPLLPLIHQHGKPSPVTPSRVLWLLLIAGLLIQFKQRWAAIFDKVFYTVLGLTGLLLTFLWLLSDHQSMAYNLNLLWAMPTHLYFIFRVKMMHPAAGVSTNINRVATIYFRMVFFIALGIMLLWPLIPQAYNSAFFPVAGLVALTAWKYTNFRLRRNS